jgi:hypothetical protein
MSRRIVPLQFTHQNYDMCALLEGKLSSFSFCLINHMSIIHTYHVALLRFVDYILSPSLKQPLTFLRFVPN